MFTAFVVPRAGNHEWWYVQDRLSPRLSPHVGSKVIFELKKNFMKLLGDTKLYRLSNYKARFLTALLNRRVKGSIWPLKWAVSV